MTVPATTPQAQLDRTRYLHQLYLADGRDHPDHPMHMLMTGLYQQRIERLLEADKATLLGLDETDGPQDSALFEMLEPCVDVALGGQDSSKVLVYFWLSILATRMKLAINKLAAPNATAEGLTHAQAAVLTVAQWLQDEAARAERATVKRFTPEELQEIRERNYR